MDFFQLLLQTVESVGPWSFHSAHVILTCPISKAQGVLAKRVGIEEGKQNNIKKFNTRKTEIANSRFEWKEHISVGLAFVFVSCIMIYCEGRESIHSTKRRCLRNDFYTFFINAWCFRRGL
jgi:hypothetical protein